MAGGGGGAKEGEPQPHPPKEQLPGVSFCITSPPPWREYLSTNPLLSILHSFNFFGGNSVFLVQS